MGKDVKKCCCETLETLKEKYIHGYWSGIGEEIKGFTPIAFFYDEKGNPVYGSVLVCMYYWKTNEYTIRIGSEFESFDIPINYCPMCGRKLTEE